MAACPDGEDCYDYLVAEVTTPRLKYRCNGIILTGFYGNEQ